MSKKEKIKAWYEEHKRGIRDAAMYGLGACVGFGSLYLAAVLNEKRYDGDNVTTTLASKDGNYGFAYSRQLKNGKTDYDTTRYLSWTKDEAKEVAEHFLKFVNEDETKES